MLAYLAHRPAVASRRASPNSLLVVIAGHVAVVAVVMSVKMDLPSRILDVPPKVEFLPIPEKQIKEPLERPDPAPRPLSKPTVVDSIVPLPPDPLDQDPIPLPPNPPPPSGSQVGTGTGVVAPPIPATPAILLTGTAELKPPYPPSKLASGEEAILKLRLSIAADGRVVAVEPMGRADPIFLNAARRHILAHWRYRPASRDGKDVMTSLVVSLRFQLDD